jgi:hypothetical protein
MADRPPSYARAHHWIAYATELEQELARAKADRDEWVRKTDDALHGWHESEARVEVLNQLVRGLRDDVRLAAEQRDEARAALEFANDTGELLLDQLHRATDALKYQQGATELWRNHAGRLNAQLDDIERG